MGKVTLGSSNGKSRMAIKPPSEVAVEVQPITPDPIIQRVEVPVEVVIERVKEVSVPVVEERIVEVIKTVEVPVIQEKVIIQEVMVPVERTVFVEKPVEVIKEVKIIDIEKLMIERERVRLLKQSNAILRVAIITLVTLGFLVIGVLHG